MISVAGLNAFAGRAAIWLCVALGFSIPVSTALDSLLVAALLLSWAAGGRYRDKWLAIRSSPFAIAAIAFFALHLAGAAYSQGTAEDVRRALDKASVILLIPIVVSLRLELGVVRHALVAFLAALGITFVLSSAIWVGLIPEGVFKGGPLDAAVFKLKITHGVLMALGAFILANAARESANARRRMGLWILAALAAFNTLAMVQSRTGQVVLFVLLVYYLISKSPGRGMIYSLAAAILIGASAYFLPSSTLHQRAVTTVQEYREWRAGKPPTVANMRLEAWSNSLQIVKDHPAFGVGTGGFAVAYARQVHGTSMQLLRQPEQQYLLTTVQLGAVGLAALVALFAFHWHRAGMLDPARARIARALVLAIATGSLFNSFLLDHTEALLYAWLAGLLFSGQPSEVPERLADTR